MDEQIEGKRDRGCPRTTLIKKLLKMPDWEPTGNWREAQSPRRVEGVWKNAVKPTLRLITKEEKNYNKKLYY